MNHSAYYEILSARDRRFDGLFFVGVSSTGIYCRPICPAHTPAAKNCTFYPTTAVAEHAGFRPCLRCRPERAPRHYLNRPDMPLATRFAMDIEETLLADQTFETLAASYGISMRQLRRQFIQVFGVEPRQYLTTQRLLFAKQLLQDSAMPIPQVAFAAGFGSAGRLTVQMKRSYSQTPTQLRRSFRQSIIEQSSMTLRTDYRPPFAWQQILTFLAGRATPLEWVTDNSYHRLVDGHEIIVTDDPDKHSLLVAMPVELSSQAHTLLARVRRLFDLDAQPDLIASHLAKDPLLANAVATHPGIRLPGCWNDFEMLVRVVVGQQVSVAGATTVMRRLVDQIGITPAAIATSTPEVIVVAGMPFKRATTIWTLGHMVRTGQLDLNERDPVKFTQTLLSIPGIGPWTAAYVSMRIQKWPDAFPAGDLGLQKALIPSNRLTEKQLNQHAEHWRPWRSYAAVLLWQTLQNNGG